MSAFTLTEDQLALREAARRFAREVLHPRSMQVEQDGEHFPADVIKDMANLGLVGIDVPEIYGGQGFDTLTSAVIMEELCGGWFSAATYALSMAAGPILHVGSDELKQRVLPRLCTGEYILTMALSEPSSGTDAASLKTTAEKRGNDYVLRGTKHFITNAHRADAIIIFARTDASSKGAKGISMFLVEKGTPGMTIGQRYRTLGHEANPIWEVVLEDCVVKGENLLGDEGDGFSYVQKDFAKIRAIYGARCVGLAQAALDYAVDYANGRQQFGQSIASFQGNRFKIADLLTQIEAARCLSYRACAAADAKSPDAAVAASMAKNFASGVAMAVTSEAIQLMGGQGYTRDHPLERYYREAKLFQIGDGSTEALRILISRHALRAADSHGSTRIN